MKRRIERIELLIRIKKQITQNKLLEYVSINRQYEEEKNKKNQLINYKADYVCQLNNQGQHGLGMDKVKYITDFINQLDKLVQQQFLELNRLQIAVNKAHNEYLQVKANADSLVKLLDKLNSSFTEKESRLLQKQCDEAIQAQLHYVRREQ